MMIDDATDDRVNATTSVYDYHGYFIICQLNVFDIGNSKLVQDYLLTGTKNVQCSKGITT